MYIVQFCLCFTPPKKRLCGFFLLLNNSNNISAINERLKRLQQKMQYTFRKFTVELTEILLYAVRALTYIYRSAGEER